MAVLHRAFIDALLDGNKYVSSVRDSLDAEIEASRAELYRQYQMANQLGRALNADGNEEEKTAIRAFLNALRGGVQE